MDTVEQIRAEMRNAARLYRAQISELEHRRMSVSLVDRILNDSTVKAASTVAGFWPVRGEPDILPALQSLQARGQRIVLPVISEQGLVFREPRGFEPDQNPPGTWGIPEPSGAEMPLDQINLFLIPGLVFGGDGTRLGYGKGYYDRALENAPKHALRLGIIFSKCLRSGIPAYSHDLPMHLIMTEEATIRCGKQGGGGDLPGNEA